VLSDEGAGALEARTRDPAFEGGSCFEPTGTTVQMKGGQLAELAGFVYLAAIVAVALGLMAALWIAGLFALGYAAVVAFAWATR
jgi:hypothetical protein